MCYTCAYMLYGDGYGIRPFALSLSASYDGKSMEIIVIWCWGVYVRYLRAFVIYTSSPFSLPLVQMVFECLCSAFYLQRSDFIDSLVHYSEENESSLHFWEGRMMRRGQRISVPSWNIQGALQRLLAYTMTVFTIMSSTERMSHRTAFSQGL